ncbi:uncharacterized protein LOC117586264 [Drosophila guanche]|uniref:Uncharacterized protein n=1 Tax=Drosophila guanche TaxID=7266 RepID=A0A3B0K7P5_DROGU|nr:uncharacterized protein LOC117586264 [Drosophila guanche]SPP84090.1 Hypothetical predicted protein [Drosophila guanche]
MEDNKPIDRKSRVTAMRKTMNFDHHSTMRMSGFLRDTGSLNFPNLDTSMQLTQFKARSSNERFEIQERTKVRRGDDADVMSRFPSYAKFNVNYSFVCRQRYSKACRDYEAQFQREIANMIDFQCSAVEMVSLIRNMAYCTLWPPMHNHAELKYTDAKFFQLTKKEKTRYDKIMSTGIQ